MIFHPPPMREALTVWRFAVVEHHSRACAQLSERLPQRAVRRKSRLAERTERVERHAEVRAVRHTERSLRARERAPIERRSRRLWSSRGWCCRAA